MSKTFLLTCPKIFGIVLSETIRPMHRATVHQRIAEDLKNNGYYETPITKSKLKLNSFLLKLYSRDELIAKESRDQNGKSGKL